MTYDLLPKRPKSGCEQRSGRVWYDRYHDDQPSGSNCVFIVITICWSWEGRVEI